VVSESGHNKLPAGSRQFNESAHPDGYILGVDYSQSDQIQLNGKIVIAWHKDRGLTVSRLRRFDHTEVLEPENHGYEAITLGAKQRWTILAKVLWWIAMAP
jgi:SOS-response transcriptional repressor LexA